MRLKDFNIVYQIARTELRVIFYSPVAWLILVVFAVQCGFSFCDVIWPAIKSQSLGYEVQALTGSVFTSGKGIFPVMLEHLYFYIPLLTMGLMSREFSSGSIKLLYSSPVTSAQIILGKYLSVMIYCAVLLGVILVYVGLGALTIGHMDGTLIFSNFLGMYLLICAYAVIGLFMSCLTSYQVVAAIGTLAFLSFLNFIGGVGQEIPLVRDITYWLALNGRVGLFVAGMINTENLIYFLVVIAAFLLLSVWRLQAVREKQPGRKKILKLTGLAVGVVVLSYVSSRPFLTWYWDTTATQSNTISVLSQDLLRQLKGELKITTYVNLLDANYESGLPAAHKKDFERFRPYARFKRNLKLDYVYYYDYAGYKYLDELYPGLSDRERAEKICQAKGLDFGMFLTPEEIRRKIDLSGELNHFVRQVEWNGERKTWLRVYKDMYVFPSEQEMTAALKRLLVKRPKLCFLTGYGERNSTNKREMDYSFFSSELSLRSALINQGFDVEDFSLSGKERIPDEVDILVIADVRSKIPEGDFRMICEYIERGGNLFLLGEPGTQEFINPLAELIGVRFRNGMLLQAREGYLPSLTIAGMDPEGDEKFPVFQKMRQYGFCFALPGCTGLEIQKKAFGITPVACVGDSISWQVNRLYAEDALKGLNHPGPAEGKVLPVIVALDRKVGDKDQRILVAGDADCISNAELTRARQGVKTANFTLATESFRWLARDEFPVLLPSIPPRDNELYLGRKDMPWLKFGTMGLLPGLLALAYGVVHYRRKRN